LERQSTTTMSAISNGWRIRWEISYWTRLSLRQDLQHIDERMALVLCQLRYSDCQSLRCTGLRRPPRLRTGRNEKIWFLLRSHNADGGEQTRSRIGALPITNRRAQRSVACRANHDFDSRILVGRYRLRRQLITNPIGGFRHDNAQSAACGSEGRGATAQYSADDDKVGV
jgi:hypothetical protein